MASYKLQLNYSAPQDWIDNQDKQKDLLLNKLLEIFQADKAKPEHFAIGLVAQKDDDDDNQIIEPNKLDFIVYVEFEEKYRAEMYNPDTHFTFQDVVPTRVKISHNLCYFQEDSVRRFK